MPADVTHSASPFRIRLTAALLELSPLVALPFIPPPFPLPLACTILPALLRLGIRQRTLHASLTGTVNTLLTLQLLSLFGTIFIPLLPMQFPILAAPGMFAIWFFIPFTVFLPYSMAALAFVRSLCTLGGATPRWMAIPWVQSTSR